MFGDFPSVVIYLNGAAIASTGNIFNVITDGQYDLVGDKAFIDKNQHKQVCHFPDNEFRLFIIIGTMEDLAGAQAAAFWLICFDIRNRCRLPAPAVADQQLGVDAKELIEKVFVVVIMRTSNGAVGDIPIVNNPFFCSSFA